MRTVLCAFFCCVAASLIHFQAAFAEQELYKMPLENNRDSKVDHAFLVSGRKRAALDTGFVRELPKEESSSSRRSRFFWIPIPDFFSKPKKNLFFKQTTTPAPAAALTPFDRVSQMQHDALRLIHGVPLLRFNPTLKALAATCADYHALSSTVIPDPNTDPVANYCPSIQSSSFPAAGELLGSLDTTNGEPAETNLLRAFIWYEWYTDVDANYTMDWANFQYNPDWVEKVQLIWRSSTDFACAASRISFTGAKYLSCIYNPGADRSDSTAVKNNVFPPIY